MKTPYEYKFVVDKEMLDTLGHVNNAVYLKLYEDARWEILKLSGFTSNSIKSMGVGPIIMEVTIRFKNEMKLGQEVIIETQSSRKGSRLFIFEQLMRNEQGKIFSTAIFTGALFDLKKRKMITANEEWVSAFGL